jgi:hypothetical protein
VPDPPIVTEPEPAGPVPTALIAGTDNRYVKPATRLVKVNDRVVAATVVDHGPVPPLSLPSRNTRYPVIADPPSLAGS